MIDLARKISTADSSMKQGAWEKSKFHGTELSGKKYGTIGIGRIGQRVAHIARGLNMQILANDVIPIPEDLIKRLDVQVSTQEQVFSQADFVDLHVPLTPETKDLVNYDKLRLMKKSAYLVNTSRGGVVNEHDLLRALDEGLIAGAALDVFQEEPPKSLELRKNPKLITTPHIAGQTQEAQITAGTQIAMLVLEALGA
jgi:D-3-phosphoglycerate dehydrogenase / 2-oxoglutarate reductase